MLAQIQNYSSCVDHNKEESEKFARWIWNEWENPEWMCERELHNFEEYKIEKHMKERGKLFREWKEGDRIKDRDNTLED